MKKYRHETVAGIFVFVGLLCVGYMAIKLGKFTPFGDHTYVLYARFTSVSGLRVGNPVEMFGIQIGEVKDLKMDQKDQLALVALRINKGIRIYGDANAAIKAGGNDHTNGAPGEYWRPDRKIYIWWSQERLIKGR
jgi:phospholipid/cholesterol/gamma-HCH transport system substrate-binding protein